MGETEYPWRDEARLRELYVEQHMTSQEVSEVLGCHPHTVKRWLHRHGIETRRRGDYTTPQDKPWYDEDLLRELYIDQQRTMADIADELGCSEKTIYKQLKAFEIPRRDNHGNNTEVYWRDRERLYELYNAKGLSRAEIAERWDTTEATIREWVRKHQLPPQETTA